MAVLAVVLLGPNHIIVQAVFLIAGVIHEVLEYLQGVGVDLADFRRTQVAVACPDLASAEDVAARRGHRNHPCKLDLHQLAVVGEQAVVEEYLGVHSFDALGEVGQLEVEFKMQLLLHLVGNTQFVPLAGVHLDEDLLHVVRQQRVVPKQTLYQVLTKERIEEQHVDEIKLQVDWHHFILVPLAAAHLPVATELQLVLELLATVLKEEIKRQLLVNLVVEN